MQLPCHGSALPSHAASREIATISRLAASETLLVQAYANSSCTRMQKQHPSPKKNAVLWEASLPKRMKTGQSSENSCE
jgi:hypothetical protein